MLSLVKASCRSSWRSSNTCFRDWSWARIGILTARRRIGGRGPGERSLRQTAGVFATAWPSLKSRSKAPPPTVRTPQEPFAKNLPVISLVGYTNAGKSTLLNALTQSDVHAEKKMFATLDPTSRRLRLPYEQEVIINDTVGFIRDLPETLVAAFRATLEEISDSDLLVHVVDASSPGAIQQIASVDKILTDLQLNEIPQIIVLNKIDLTDEQSVEILSRQAALDHDVEPVAISAIRRDSLRPLVEHLAARIGSVSIDDAVPDLEQAARGSAISE